MFYDVQSHISVGNETGGFEAISREHENLFCFKRDYKSPPRIPKLCFRSKNMRQKKKPVTTLSLTKKTVEIVCR